MHVAIERRSTSLTNLERRNTLKSLLSLPISVAAITTSIGWYLVLL